MNIKFFKILFNRALRVKNFDVQRAETMFRYLIQQLSDMFNDSETFYAVKVMLELSQAYMQMTLIWDALQQLTRADEILKTKFGGKDSPVYLTFYLRQLETKVSIAASNTEKANKWR